MSTKKPTGGPAFPDVQFTHNNGDTSFKNNGMSLRDHFAGQALAGWLASYGPENKHPSEIGEEIAANVAKYSYALADAMIAERDK